MKNLFRFLTKKKQTSKLKVVSLFAGIGGFELGLKDLGEVVWANEWDKWACKTYRANFPNHNLIEGDIRKIKVEDIPKHDILVGGFPCQTFSLAQSNKENKGLNDPRGHLFKEILRIAEYHKPNWLLLENVKGLTFKTNKEAFDLIIKGIEDLGYKVNWKVLNAKDYGVPQNRERIYFVCHREGKPLIFPTPTKEPTKISDILLDEVDNKYYLSDKAWEGMKARKNNGHPAYGLFKETDPNTATLRARYYKDGSEILIAGMGMGGNIPLIFQWRRNYIRENKENVSFCLVGGKEHVPFVKRNRENPRKLTPRECARLQGFNDDFKIVCSDAQTYKQFGNAVAVPVVKAIAKQIFKYIQ